MRALLSIARQITLDDVLGAVLLTLWCIGLLVAAPIIEAMVM